MWSNMSPIFKTYEDLDIKIKIMRVGLYHGLVHVTDIMELYACINTHVGASRSW